MATLQRLPVREFLFRVRDQAEAALDGHADRASARVVFSSLQIHFGDPRLHYEVWPVRKTGRIEVGLHIEGPRDWSRAVATRLAARADDIRRALGPAYELEEWTAAWCRLHETVPYDRLTDDLVSEVTARLVTLVNAVQPILGSLSLTDLDGIGAPASGPRKRGRRRWRRRRSA